MYVFACAYACVYVYIYIYIHISKHRCIYIYIHIHINHTQLCIRAMNRNNDMSSKDICRQGTAGSTLARRVLRRRWVWVAVSLLVLHGFRV